MRRARTLIGTALLAATALTACSSSGGDSSSNGKVTLRYALWVDTQQPAYQDCANAFHRAHPKVTIKIEQTAWAEYWTNLTTEVTAGTAPDVFTDSVAYYPDFQTNHQIVDIEPYVKRDKVDLSQFRPGLADLWVRDGKRYGLPKDWDAVGLVYNTKLLADAGVDAASLQDLSWNPTDGGDFEKLIAKLTVDDHGRRGDQPGFDKNHVKTYGIVLDLDAGSGGQTSWGNLAVANGFTFLDKNPFGTHYHYDDPKLAATISWIKGLQDKGYLGRYSQHSSLGSDAVLGAGKAAMGMAGSWMASTYFSNKKVKFAFAPLPVGPAGRHTASNTLSDAIYAGGKHKDEAWQWVKFLASPQCQSLVAKRAVVFPAITSASDEALSAFKAQKLDMQAFVTETSQPGASFLLPLTDHAGDIAQAVQDALDSVWLGRESAADTLKKVNDHVNGLFK
jgi:multiple sugar transport system substrate-binding protein